MDAEHADATDSTVSAPAAEGPPGPGARTPGPPAAADGAPRSAPEEDVCATIPRFLEWTDKSRPWEPPRVIFLQYMQTPLYSEPLVYPEGEAVALRISHYGRIAGFDFSGVV